MKVSIAKRIDQAEFELIHANNKLERALTKKREIDRMGSYGWVITQDLIDMGDENGTVGGNRARFTIEYLIENGKTFRILDDDNTVCYVGKMFAEDDEDELAPLEDFGQPIGGCAYIEYYIDGKWVAL